MDSLINRTIKAVGELMRRREWVPWHRVAEDLTGDPNESPRFEALSSLPEYKDLFVEPKNGNVVKLSQVGLARFEDLESETQTSQKTDTPQSAVNAVKQYANRLKPLELKVSRIAVIKRAGSWIVHAVYVDAIDDVFNAETPVELTRFGQTNVHGKIVGQEPDGHVLYTTTRLKARILGSHET